MMPEVNRGNSTWGSVKSKDWEKGQMYTKNYIDFQNLQGILKNFELLLDLSDNV